MKSNTLVPRLDDLPALAPDRLAAQAAEAVRELLAEAAAANTTRSVLRKMLISKSPLGMVSCHTKH